MKNLLLAACMFFGCMNVCEACVSYNPHTNTYTVDTNGSVKGSGKHAKHKHEKKHKSKR